MRETVLIVIGATGGVIASALGGFDHFLHALFVLMAVDYISGLVVAGIFKKSKKTRTGALNSHVGFKGIVKKAMMLLMVLVAYRLDYVIGWEFVRYGMIIALLVNELISIAENAGLMGIPVSAVFKKAINILGKRGGEDANGDRKDANGDRKDETEGDRRSDSKDETEGDRHSDSKDGHHKLL